MVGRMRDLAIGTFSSVTRTPARAELRSELCVYALAIAPASVSARAGTVAIAAESTSAAATLLRKFDTCPLFRLQRASDPHPLGNVTPSPSISPADQACR